MYIPHFVTLSSFHGPLGCVRILATGNNAAVNIGAQISLRDPAVNCFWYSEKRNRSIWGIFQVMQLLDHDNSIFL